MGGTTTATQLLEKLTHKWYYQLGVAGTLVGFGAFSAYEWAQVVKRDDLKKVTKDVDAKLTSLKDDLKEVTKDVDAKLTSLKDDLKEVTKDVDAKLTSLKDDLKESITTGLRLHEAQERGAWKAIRSEQKGFQRGLGIRGVEKADHASHEERIRKLEALATKEQQIS